MIASTPETLFSRLSSPEQLSLAWQRVKANGGAAGRDGITVERFALVAAAQIDLLARQLGDGSYRPSPARRVYLPKRSGGVRPLDIPSVFDRVAQASCAMVLDERLDRVMEDSSFAYRRGRSVAQAVARIAALRRNGFVHVVDGDIKAYFETIPHERLMAKLERHVDDAAVIDLIWLWLETYSLTGRGVPQGSPVSPLLANLYLDDVDERIVGRGVRLVRFADDYLLLCTSAAAAEGAMARMAALLADEGLEMHPEKSRVTSFEEGFRFLGHVFVRALTMPEERADETPDEDAIAAAESAARAADEEAVEAFPESEPEKRLSDPLFPVYVVEPGRTLIVRGARLALRDDAGRLVDLPPRAIQRIELGADAEATMAALDLAAAHGVEVVRIGGDGALLGRYEATAPERARRHLAQARTILDEAARATLAGLLVEGRIRNQRALLRRLNRERRDPDIAAACAKMARPIRAARFAPSVEEAMGREGEAAALYWPALGRALPEEFRFRLRQRQPARNPANAVISALSSLLARDIRALALRAGLHPGFGVLHATTDGAEALVYDLMEEFRAPVAEACASALFNRRALRAEMFDMGATALRFDRAAWPAIIRGYESWVARPVRSPRSGRDVLWRALMLEQAQAYAVHCEGGETYHPYLMDH
jgi:CRISPR-associated protein Cas1